MDGSWFEALMLSVGRMHVASVHFPIALLLVGAALELFGGRARADAARVLILLGAISSVAAAALGWLHAWAEPLGSSAHTTLDRHRWIGTACALFACLAAWSGSGAKLRRLALVMAALSASFAGHLGGDLVYGENYFFAPLLERGNTKPQAPPANTPPPVATPGPASYERNVKPVLDTYCIECHGERKQKGKLRLDRFDEAWFVPGEYSTLVVRGDPAQSELLARIHLPPDDEDHMPPADEPQLAPDQVTLLERWIREGAVQR